MEERRQSADPKSIPWKGYYEKDVKVSANCKRPRKFTGACLLGHNIWELMSYMVNNVDSK